MKKILLLCIVLFCCLKSFSQTITLTGPSSVTNSTEFLITASGETDNKFISYIEYDHFGSTSNTFAPPAGPYLSNDGFSSGNPRLYTRYVSPRLPTAFHFKATTIGYSNSLNFHFIVSYTNGSTGAVTSNQDLYFTITLNPPPPTWYNDATPGVFTKNNCTGGNVGSTVTYTVPANSYSSTISKADANAKAQNEVDANGQAYANANGTCSPPAPIINGEITICRDNNEHTYTIANLPTGVTVTWSSLYQIQIVSSTSTTATIKYSSTPASPLKGHLIATLSNGTTVVKLILNENCDLD